MVIFDEKIHLLDIIKLYSAGGDEYRDCLSMPETLLTISHEWFAVFSTVRLLRPDVIDTACLSTLNGQLEHSLTDEFISAGFSLESEVGDSFEDIEGGAYFWADRVVSNVIKLSQ